MGNSENLEIKIKNEAGEPKIDLADRAIVEARERIIKELKSAQDDSKDEYFTKIEIDKLSDSALIMLNELTKRFSNPFSEEVINTAKEFYLKDNELLEGDKIYDPIEPEKEKEFFAEQIMKYPDVFNKYIFKNEKQADMPINAQDQANI